MWAGWNYSITIGKYKNVKKKPRTIKNNNIIEAGTPKNLFLVHRSRFQYDENLTPSPRFWFNKTIQKKLSILKTQRKTALGRSRIFRVRRRSSLAHVYVHSHLYLYNNTYINIYISPRRPFAHVTFSAGIPMARPKLQSPLFVLLFQTSRRANRSFQRPVCLHPCLRIKYSVTGDGGVWPCPRYMWGGCGRAL